MEDKKSFETIEKWNEEIENILNNLVTSCEKYSELCQIQSVKQSRIYNILMYFIIILTPISGILSISNNDLLLLQSFITVISFSSGIASAVVKFSKFDQKSVSYKTFSAKYLSLKNNIKRQLSLGIKDRCDPVQYLEYITKSYDSLYENMPLLDEKDYVEKKVVHVPKGVPTEELPEKNSPVQGEIKIDISKFSDPAMKYELNRLYLQK